MPFRSEAQRRWMFWAVKHGKLPRKVLEKFRRATPKGIRLPERVKHSSAFVDEFVRLNIERGLGSFREFEDEP